MTTLPPICPDRIRRIGDQTFAFIPHRFLRDGFFVSMTLEERSLYLFLVLAADRNGVSFYGYDRICSTLELTLDSYLLARNALIDQNLIAFDGTRFQVLSLPREVALSSSERLLSQEDLEMHDPGTVRHIILDALDDNGASR